MSQRLAFMKLQNALRGGSESERAAWQERLRDWDLVDTVFPDLTDVLVPGGRMSDSFREALNELAIPPEPVVPGERRRLSDEVAPIEKLDLLIRLARDRQAGAHIDEVTDEEKGAIEAVASSLFVTQSEEQLTKLLAAIEKMAATNQQLIRVPDLEEDGSLQRITRPQPPRAASEPPRTVAQALRAVEAGLATELLVDSLANHPLVDVDTRIYKAVIGGEAEYAAHLRTTISFPIPPPQIARFAPLLEPANWPTFNPFWLAMQKIQANGPKGGVQLDAAPAEEGPTPKEAAISRAATYMAHVHEIGWDSVGTYLEEVGFENGPVAVGQDGGGPAHGALALAEDDGDRGLYEDTYLYFSRAKTAGERELLTYTLLRRLATLRVDDGCIEIRGTVAGGVDVVTTKSLYVSGDGSDIERNGTLAYLAAYFGWGANTLMLVSNALSPANN